jgi:hypothetical protein
MRKNIFLIFALIITCGGSNEETFVQDTTTTFVQDTTTTFVQDTTTTTIPPAPSVDFNIVEIYTSKLGTDLCSDAEEIGTTSEECLRQYRDNLETVFSYAENLETYITELSIYLEAYPSEITEEYKNLFQFIDNEYQAVPETYGTVASKYIERFGGEPVLSNINFLDQEKLSVGCSVDWNIQTSENFKDGYVIYKNNTNESFKIDLKNKSGSVEFLNSGGEFIPTEIIYRNYLDEEYSSNVFQNIFIKHMYARLVKLEFDSSDISQDEEVKLYIEWEDGYEDEEILYFGITFYSDYGFGGTTDLGISDSYPWEGLMYGGYVDYELNSGYFRLVRDKTASFSRDGEIGYFNNGYDPVKSPYYVSWLSINYKNYRVEINFAKLGDNSVMSYSDYRNKCKPLINNVEVPVDFEKISIILND